MTAEDFLFLSQVLNFGVVLLAAVIIAWSRHGQPEREEKILPGRFVQFIYRQDADYVSIREREDRLTQAEKNIIRSMVENKQALSFRGAADYGIKRAGWNRIRSNLVNMGVADFGQSGEVVLNARGKEYLHL